MYRVLIVDDDLATLYMLKRYKNWTDYGFVIAGEACDGREALSKLKENKYDLIITDIKMPGMDGIEFIQELRNQDINSCVILLSTHSDFQFAKQGIRFGVFEYMTKPFEETVLIDILARAKTFIDIKKEQEAKLSGLEKVNEEVNGIYYPGDFENLIISNILIADQPLNTVAMDTFREICTLYDNDFSKVRVIMNTLLFNIETKISQRFPWLNKVEGINTGSPFTEASDRGEIEKYFISRLTVLHDRIQKYQLNHQDSLIRKICQCIIDNIENEISLEFIANEVHISKDYVGKLFKQKVACNFNDYVTKIKMEHAKYLIASGNYKNYEISEKLGYRKADYFSSLFKAYTGMTPMEYKKCNF